MSDFQAKILLNQIKELKNYRLKKIKLFNQFHNSIKNSNISVFNHYNFDKDFIYRFILIFKNQKQRDKVKKQLYRSKIFTRVPVMQFELLHNYLKLNKKNYFISDQIAKTTLSIPFHNHLNSKNIKKINYHLKKI